ncbi:sensor domain-containing protein [Streptomyces sp. NPDC002886]|uniref:sensor domain-containing protein n=1 Tax=Streptomyces sp. NPDC002886 TaxID=3364667 RepID=UPI0036814179
MKARTATAVLLPALLSVTVGCGSTNTPASGKGPDPKGSASAPGQAGSSGASAAAGASGSAGTGGAGETGATAAAGGTAGPRRGAGRLERAALEQGDLTGYQISANGKNPNAPDGQPQADRKACQPLADIMGDKPDPAARETVNRGIGSQKQLGLAVSASVSSYAESDAKALIARLKDAVAACAGGFTATVEKQTGTYRDVKAADYKTGGDESVSWTTTAAAEGVTAQVHLVVVRQGDTVMRLMALNVTGGRQTPQVPHEVADKQLQKVRAAR